MSPNQVWGLMFRQILHSYMINSIGNDFYRIQTDTQDTCLMCHWKKGTEDQIQLNIRTIGLEEVIKSGDYDAKIVKKVGRKHWLWAEDAKLGLIIEIRE